MRLNRFIILTLATIFFTYHTANAENDVPIFTYTSSAANSEPSDWTYDQIHEHSAGKGIPIILVHGNKSEAQEKARWGTYENYIKNNPSAYENFDVYIWKHNTAKAIGFNGNSGNAKDLSDFINVLISAKPNYGSFTKFIFVAHSRGGLVCRSYMNYDYDGDGKLEGNKVLGLITLGTPHHGSPGAVPDWAAFSFSENYSDFVSLPFFNSTYCEGSGCEGFDIDRLGDLNLAWDNMDDVLLVASDSIFYPANISHLGEMWLSERDLNAESDIQFTDHTNFYKDKWNAENFKGQYGTLYDLNLKEKYAKKIVAFAAYDNDFTDNIDLQDIIGIVFFDYDHDKLEASTVLLAGFTDDNFTKPGISYDANDGLVPLQSALFLNISEGTTFFETTKGGSVSLYADRIKSYKQVKKQYYFTGDISDHLHLLDTDNQQYWDTITSEIKAFAANPVSTITSTLLLNKD